MARKWTEEQRKAASEKARARGFGKKSPTSPSEVKILSPETATVQEVKAPPRNLFSGLAKKLDVFGVNGDSRDPIPGYRLYWFNDREGGLRIAQAQASGWQFVTRNEVALNDGDVTPGNNDLGSKVRRWVSQGEDGNAMYAYLMKKPVELCKLHDDERENYHRRIEAALTQGTFNMTSGEKRYTSANPPVGSPSGLPPISISHKMSR